MADEATPGPVVPLTPEEERRVERLLREAAEEGRRAGESTALRRVVAARARKLLRADFEAAEEILERVGLAGMVSRLAELLLPGLAERWRRGMRPVLEDVAEAATEPKEEILGVGFDARNPAMAEWFEGYVSELVETVGKTTHDQVIEVVREAQEEGLSITETSERLREKAAIETKRRSDLIARTEVHRSSVGASLLQAQESGMVSTKTWRTSRDGRVRDEHRELEGDTVGVFEPFSNGLQFPSEPNCRCYLQFGLDWDAMEARDDRAARLEEARDVWREHLADGVELPNGEVVRATEEDFRHFIDREPRFLANPAWLRKIAENAVEILEAKADAHRVLSHWQEGDRDRWGYAIIVPSGRIVSLHITREAEVRRFRRRERSLWRRS